MKKLEPKDINSVWDIIFVLQEKKTATDLSKDNLAWVYLATLLYANISKKTLTHLLNTLNEMENK